MRLSTNRILTTHVGSMPRLQEVVDWLFAEDNDQLTADQRAQYDEVMQRNVASVVHKQLDAGVDIPSEG